MSRTQKSISISVKNQILNKLSLNEPTINPICPVNKGYKSKITSRYAKKAIISIEEQIQSIKSIKIIKPYKTEKNINILHPQTSIQYSITAILKTPQYKRLQRKLIDMNSSYTIQKQKLVRQTKELDKQISSQGRKTQNLYRKLIDLDHDVDQFKEKYYQMRRVNYQLRCQLDQRNGGPQFRQLDWNNRPNIIHQNDQNIDLDQMNYEQILQLEERLGKQNVGLSSEMLSRLKQIKYFKIKQRNDEQLNCCICCQTVQDHSNVIKLDQCGHIHHSECIKQWLKIKRFCPLCKQEVYINNK